MVRDQGVVGSNPIAPTNSRLLFQIHASVPFLAFESISPIAEDQRLAMEPAHHA